MSMKTLKIIFLHLCLFLTFPLYASDVDLKVNDPAPSFKLKTHTGNDFDLEAQKGKWTVLYFYPKAETPGCTKQACSFRDNIKKITNLGAEVYGISTDNVKDQAAFHKNHDLNFVLLADDQALVVNKYGSKMSMMNMSKRWTFIINPKLIIKDISHDVDPITDSTRVAGIIEKLQKEKN